MNTHFTAVVVGNNPEELLSTYDGAKKVSPYAVFHYSLAKDYHEKYIKYYEELLKLKNVVGADREMAQATLDYYKSIDDIEFYLDLTEGMTLDDETGDAMSVENPEKKFDTHALGRLCISLMLKDGTEVYSAKKKDIDWSAIHLAGQDQYEAVWDMVMGNRKPKTEMEHQMYENMRYRTAYLESYGDKETYVNNNTSFWGWAFLSKESGWLELEPNMSQHEWVRKFYDRFIVPLDDEATISIYGCTREK